MNARAKHFTAEDAERAEKSSRHPYDPASPDLSFSARSAFSAVGVFLPFQGAACP